MNSPVEHHIHRTVCPVAMWDSVTVASWCLPLLSCPWCWWHCHYRQRSCHLRGVNQRMTDEWENGTWREIEVMKHQERRGKNGDKRYNSFAIQDQGWVKQLSALSLKCLMVLDLPSNWSNEALCANLTSKSHKAGSQYDDSPSFCSTSSVVVVTSYCEL